MITDTGDIQIIRENQLGIYDTVRVQAVYCVARPDGSHYIKLSDGSAMVTKPSTVVIELGETKR